MLCVVWRLPSLGEIPPPATRPGSLKTRLKRLQTPRASCCPLAAPLSPLSHPHLEPWGKTRGFPGLTTKHTFTACSVCWGSPYYCDGWRRKRGKRWPLPPHHLSMNSEQLDRRWGNYTAIIMRTCAQAYTLSHCINTVLCTPDGVPNVFSPMPPSLLPSSIHLCSTIFSPQSSLATPTGEFHLSRKACQQWPMVCVYTTCTTEQLCIRARMCPCSHAYTTPRRMLVLTINKACLASGLLLHWQADRCGCCCDVMLQRARFPHVLNQEIGFFAPTWQISCQLIVELHKFDFFC